MWMARTTPAQKPRGAQSRIRKAGLPDINRPFDMYVRDRRANRKPVAHSGAAALVLLQPGLYFSSPAQRRQDGPP
jgi:hypothetical protein